MILWWLRTRIITKIITSNLISTTTMMVVSLLNLILLLMLEWACQAKAKVLAWINTTLVKTTLKKKLQESIRLERPMNKEKKICGLDNRKKRLLRCKENKKQPSGLINGEMRNQHKIISWERRIWPRKKRRKERQKRKTVNQTHGYVLTIIVKWTQTATLAKKT